MEPTLTAYGTWSGGRYMHFGKPVSDADYLKAFQHAFDKGVRTFMTADVYGEGAASEKLGEALKSMDRDQISLVGMIGHDFYEGQRDGPKGFPRFTDPRLRGPDKYYDFLNTAAQKELARLGADHFDVLMLHNPDFTGYSSEAVWEAFGRLKEEGLTKSLGVAPGPANGFTLDLIHCYEKFGEQIDWAMIILNPFEPWPGELCLPAAAKHGVKTITRVVDYGGMFHGDLKPGSRLPMSDHRAFRPAGWIEAAAEKLEKIRPIADKHGLTPLQLACQWNLAHETVECVAPTVVIEHDPDARTIFEKIDDLAATPAEVKLSAEEVDQMRAVGQNKGCMALKGGSRQYLGEPQADQWNMPPELEEVAKRWDIEPDRDLYYSDDPRDLREKGMPIAGTAQAHDTRLYVQLQVFTEAHDESGIIEAVKGSGLEAVVYANVNDPRGVGVAIFTEDPTDFVTRARALYNSEPFADCMLLPDMTMIGRTYGFGREPDIKDWVLNHARRHAYNEDFQWAVWYPLRRNGEFYQLTKAEQGKILMEHGMIGRNFGSAGYAGDIRLESFGLDANDNEFVIGVVTPRLEWASKLIQAMRPTTQTSKYMDSLGPFFVGKKIWQSGPLRHMEN